MFQHSDYGPISRHAPVCRYLDVKCVVHEDNTTCVGDGACGWCVDKALCIDKRLLVSRELCTPDPDNYCTADAPHWKQQPDNAILLDNGTFASYNARRRTKCTNIVNGFFNWITLAKEPALASLDFLVNVWPEAYRTWRQQGPERDVMHYVFSDGPAGHLVGFDLLSLLSGTCYVRDKDLPEGTCFIQYPAAIMRTLGLLPKGAGALPEQQQGQGQARAGRALAASGGKAGGLRRRQGAGAGAGAADRAELDAGAESFGFVRAALGLTNGSSNGSDGIAGKDALSAQHGDDGDVCLLQPAAQGAFLNAPLLLDAARRAQARARVIALQRHSTAVEVIKAVDRCRVVMAAQQDLLAWAMFARAATKVVAVVKDGTGAGAGGVVADAASSAEEQEASMATLQGMLHSWLGRMQIFYGALQVPQEHWRGSDVTLPVQLFMDAALPGVQGSA